MMVMVMMVWLLLVLPHRQRRAGIAATAEEGRITVDRTATAEAATNELLLLLLLLKALLLVWLKSRRVAPGAAAAPTERRAADAAVVVVAEIHFRCVKRDFVHCCTEGRQELRARTTNCVRRLQDGGERRRGLVLAQNDTDRRLHEG
jgi:hypothetical protein